MTDVFPKSVRVAGGIGTVIISIVGLPYVGKSVRGSGIWNYGLFLERGRIVGT